MHDEAEARTEPADETPEKVSEAGTTPTPEPTASETVRAEQPQSQAEETFLPVDEVFAWQREKEAALATWEDQPTDATEPAGQQAVEERVEVDAPESEPESADPEPGFEPAGETEEGMEREREGATDHAERDPGASVDRRELPQYRLRPVSALDERAFQLIKQHPYQSLSLEDALAQARAEQEGVSEDTASVDNGATGEGETGSVGSQPASDALEALDFLSAAELAGEIARQRSENLDVLRQNLDVSAYAAGENRLAALEQAREAVIRREAVEAEAVAQANRQQAESRAAALEKYPDLQDGESAFAVRHAEVLATWEAMRDSRAVEGDAPMQVADLVARELGLTPSPEPGGENPPPPEPSRSPESPQVVAGRSAATPPRPQSRAAAPRRTQAAIPVAPSSGAQRTQSHQPRVAAALDAVQTPEDYERLKQSIST